MRVRDATEHDAAACAAIYAPYVTDTAVTFESEPPTTAAMAGRITAAQRTARCNGSSVTADARATTPCSSA
jgi:L-amino acid N-acyltransferase YncA